jgi:hypothetical protein
MVVLAGCASQALRRRLVQLAAEWGRRSFQLRHFCSPYHQDSALLGLRCEVLGNHAEVWFARDSPLEGAGFEPSVPRPIINGFEVSPELEPTDPRRGGSAEQLRPDQPIGSEAAIRRAAADAESEAARPRAGALSATRARCGTEGSNPSSSSGESAANSTRGFSRILDEMFRAGAR